MTTPDLRQETETEVVKPLLNDFWRSKGNSVGHSERKKKRWDDNIKDGQGWTLPTQLGQAKTELCIN